MAEVESASLKTPEWLYPANLVTELRLLTIPFILIAVVLHRAGWALALFFAAAVSDGIDGWLARRSQKHSTLGSTLDPLADKLLVSSLFIALSLAGEMPWTVTLLVFIRDLSIATCALVLFTQTGFKDFRPTWWGKASTTAELATVTVALLYAAVPAVWELRLEEFGWFAVSAFTVFTGVHYALISAQRYAGFRHLNESR